MTSFEPFSAEPDDTGTDVDSDRTHAAADHSIADRSRDSRDRSAMMSAHGQHTTDYADGFSVHGSTVVLPEALDNDRALGLKTALMAAFNNGEPVVIDAGAVERVGMAGLQIMIAAFRHADDNSLSLRLEGDSGPLADAFADLGLTDLFGRLTTNR